VSDPHRPLVVCDASVALAWLNGEPVPAWADEFWADVEGGRADVRVPTLFWLEVGNFVVRRRDMTDDQALEGPIRLEWLGFQTVEMDRPLRMMAIQLARRLRLSAYDATYLALAQALDAPLVTVDARLGAAAQISGRRFGVERGSAMGEARASYGSDREPDPISLAAIGAYLAELRSATG
jgi:predicted nucleic acid-binding protein